MTHMVIFRNAEGMPGYHQAGDLAESVQFVERLRNEEGVTDSRIFLMREIPIEFKQYFRVEVGQTPDGDMPAPDAVPAKSTNGSSPEPAGPDGLEMATTGGRSGLFNRS